MGIFIAIKWFTVSYVIIIFLKGVAGFAKFAKEGRNLLFRFLLEMQRQYNAYCNGDHKGYG